MAEQIHGHMPPALGVEDVLADPAGACPDCVRLVIRQLSDALRLAESDGDSARRDLAGAYKVLIGVMPGSRPASTTAAAERAAKMIRDHEAERRRVLDERDAARKVRDDSARVVEQLRKELAETTHALEVTGEKVTALRKQRDQAETERDRIRTAWDSARRGRKQARGQLKAARPYIDWLHEQRRTLSAERDAAREQVARVRARHFAQPLYEECGHRHEKPDAATGVREVRAVGLVCADGYDYTVCRTCCCDPDGDQSRECAENHGRECWPCAEIRALDGTEATP